MVSFKKIAEINSAGWILFHSKTCGYCLDIKKRVGILKWVMMNKRECSNTMCPPQITSFPTWLNTHTLETWSGEGVFR
jgi:hypothetical protein